MNHEIECVCGHSWPLSTGGLDPYICHQCGHNNETLGIIVSKEDKEYIEECIKSGEVLREDLRRWFKEKWVDVSRKVDGKHPPCGRKEAKGKGYPKCRPKKKISKDTPKTAGSYSSKEKKSMTSQKRRAEKKEPKIGTGNKPTFTRYVKENTMINENIMIRLSNLVKEHLSSENIVFVQKPPVFSRNINESRITISEGLNYHIKNEKPLIENIYRIYSSKFFGLFNEARELHKSGIIELYGEDLELIKTDIGKTGIYEGEEVYLDVPFIENEEEYLVEAKHRGKNVKLNKPFRTPGGPKKFAVYVKNSRGNVVKVTFGDPNLKIRSSNKKAAKSFRARHNCQQKKDRTTAGYWSCNVSRYRKALGIKSSNPW